MSTIHSKTVGRTSDHLDASSSGRWPLIGTAAGITGFVATIVTDIHVNGDERATAALVDDISRGTAHISLVAGFITVTLLVVLTAAWRRHVEPRVAGSTAARVVSGGILLSAAALALGYGWKGSLAVYLDGGLNGSEGGFDREGLYILYVLNDFGSFVGWLGVVIALGAIAWMSLRERTVSRWIGFVSLVPVLAVTVMGASTGLPGFPGIAGPPFLAIVFAGLAFGKSTITR
jgi:hypothetical protein